jgi:hypothetical protein
MKRSGDFRISDMEDVRVRICLANCRDPVEALVEFFLEVEFDVSVLVLCSQVVMREGGYG